MSGDGTVDRHVMGDPEEALAHFTPERMAAARPRAITLDETGRRITPPVDADVPPAEVDDDEGDTDR